MLLNDFIKNSHNGNVILDKENKFAFFPHNKVAQTSITRHLLKDRAIVYKDCRITFDNYLTTYINNWKEYNPVTFTIVRNPYDRVISAFYYLKSRNKKYKKYNLNQFIIENLAEVGTSIDPHFEPQERYTKPIFEIGFDYVLKLEEINTTWPVLAKEIYANTVLPVKNVTNTKKDVLNSLSKSVIESLYSADITNLGYTQK